MTTRSITATYAILLFFFAIRVVAEEPDTVQFVTTIPLSLHNLSSGIDSLRIPLTDAVFSDFTEEEGSLDDAESIDSYLAEMDSLVACNGSIDTTKVPSAALYNSWVHHILNPYKVDMAQKRDTTLLNLQGFTPPLDSFIRITSNFGFRRYAFHYGTDLKLFVRDSVRSSFDGMVRIVRYNRSGFGHYVVVRHFNGLETIYAHLSKPLVKINQVVRSGEVLGLGGNTGRSTGAHLHYEMRYLGQSINPVELVSFETGRVLQQEVPLCAAHFSYLKQVREVKYYVVRKGDTLGHIARRCGVSVSRLCKNNGIKSTSILRIGQRLKI